MELSKCCNAKVIYVKDWGNHHDECSKCHLDIDYVNEKLAENPNHFKN